MKQEDSQPFNAARSDQAKSSVPSHKPGWFSRNAGKLVVASGIGGALATSAIMDGTPTAIESALSGMKEAMQTYKIRYEIVAAEDVNAIGTAATLLEDKPAHLRAAIKQGDSHIAIIYAGGARRGLGQPIMAVELTRNPELAEHILGKNKYDELTGIGNVLVTGRIGHADGGVLQQFGLSGAILNSERTLVPAVAIVSEEMARTHGARFIVGRTSQKAASAFQKYANVTMFPHGDDQADCIVDVKTCFDGREIKEVATWMADRVTGGRVADEKRQR